MGTTADKLTYLNTTKGKIKDSINLTGAGITNEDTFRSYAVKLRDGLVNVLNNGTIVLYNNFPKVSGTGSNISLSNTLEAPMFMNKFDGDTLQNGTPTPSTPVEIQSVEGIQTITIGDGTNANNYEINLEGKNLLPNLVNTQTLNGMIITKNNDGSLTFNGTATAGTNLNINYASGSYIYIENGKTYTASLTNNNGIYFRLAKVSGGNVITFDTPNKQLTFTSNYTGNCFVYLTIINGTTFNNLTIYPQIELGSFTSYTSYRESIKLYNGDYITGTPDNWSIVRNNGSVILNGSNEWSTLSYGGNTYISSWNQHYFDDASTNTSNIIVLSDYFKTVSWNNRIQNIPNSMYMNLADTRPRLEIRNSQWTSVSNLQTWLSTHNTKVVYKLATPTTEQITDEYLISQLNALYNAKSYNGQTNISVSGNLPMILEVSALKDEI